MTRWWPAWAPVPVVALECRRHGGLAFYTLRLGTVALTLSHRSRA